MRYAKIKQYRSTTTQYNKAKTVLYQGIDDEINNIELPRYDKIKTNTYLLFSTILHCFVCKIHAFLYSFQEHNIKRDNYSKKQYDKENRLLTRCIKNCLSRCKFSFTARWNSTTGDKAQHEYGNFSYSKTL